MQKFYQEGKMEDLRFIHTQKPLFTLLLKVSLYAKKKVAGVGGMKEEVWNILGGDWVKMLNNTNLIAHLEPVAMGLGMIELHKLLHEWIISIIALALPHILHIQYL